MVEAIDFIISEQERRWTKKEIQHRENNLDKMEGNKSVEELLTDIVEIKRGSDHFFLIVMSIIIFFMQGGFAFLEAGSVQ